MVVSVALDSQNKPNSGAAAGKLCAGRAAWAVQRAAGSVQAQGARDGWRSGQLCGEGAHAVFSHWVARQLDHKAHMRGVWLVGDVAAEQAHQVANQVQA